MSLRVTSAENPLLVTCDWQMAMVRLKVLLNWFACHDQFDLAKKGHNHIIIYSWHRVTHMWPITGFLQIFHAAWQIWANFWPHLLICRCIWDLSKILVPFIDMLLHGRSEQNFVQFTDMSLHGRSEQIFRPIYWYVAAWKIWRNPVMGHMCIYDNEYCLFKALKTNLIKITSLT
jgi:hypothetical protein